jgi:hypothetical protein
MLSFRRERRKKWFELVTARHGGGSGGIVALPLGSALSVETGAPPRANSASQTWGFRTVVRRGGVPERGRVPDAGILRDDEDSAPVIGFLPPPFRSQ